MLTASIASPRIKRMLPYIFLFFFLISTAPIIEIKIGTIYRKQNRKNIITSIKNVKSISSIILSHLSLVSITFQIALYTLTLFPFQLTFSLYIYNTRHTFPLSTSMFWTSHFYRFFVLNVNFYIYLSKFPHFLSCLIPIMYLLQCPRGIEMFLRL